MIVECPSDVELESFVEHRSHARGAPSGRSSLLSHHIETCPRCRARMEVFSKDHVLMAALADAYVVNQATMEAPPEKREKPSLGPPRIPGYGIESEIHRGGQGVVYRALQRSTKRTVALKVLLRGAGASIRQRQRFSREIDLASSLRHPNIVTIFDGGAAPDGNLYCAMEFVEGEPLDEFLRARRGLQRGDDPAALREVLVQFEKVCAAVHHAHEHGVIHRDLKPGNIVVDSAGEPRVLDFGLAKIADPERVAQTSLMTMTGEFMGTLAYASPEQTKGDPALIDARSDVYSLGVILYEMLTGRPPYRVMGAMADALRAISEDEPVPPSSWYRGEERISVPASFAALKVDDEIETIVLKALSKEKARRYQTAEELRGDIESYLKGEAIAAKRDSLGYVLRKKAWKRRVGIAAFAVALVVSVGYLVLWDEKKGLQGERIGLQQELRVTSLDKERYAARLAYEERLLFMAGAARDVQLPPADVSQIDRDATIQICTKPTLELLNPLRTASGERLVCSFLFESFFRATKTDELIPNDHLIERLDEDPDQRTKTITLREGLRWHDGKPLSSADVVFSWKQTISEAVKSSKSQVASNLGEVKEVDARTVRIRVKDDAIATWRLSANFDLVPKHLFERKIEEYPSLMEGDYYRELHRHPVGCGPFKFVEWNGNRIVLERWDDYGRSKDRPLFRRLVVHAISDAKEQLAAIESGTLDMGILTQDQYRDSVFGERFKRAAKSSKSRSSIYTAIVWNCNAELGLFHEAEVRKALCHAIDVEHLIAVATNNLATPAFGPWDNDTPFFDPNSARFRYNRDLAERMLDKAGWKKDKDGRRYREVNDGLGGTMRRPFEFKLVAYALEPTSAKAAELCIRDLAAVGVTAELVAMDNSAAYIKRYMKGDFGGCMVAMGASVDPERDREVFETGGIKNFSHYSNPRVDELFEKGAGLTKADARARVYRDIHKIIYEDQPAAFLFHNPYLFAVSHRVEGVEFGDRNGPFLFHPGFGTWWVKANP